MFECVRMSCFLTLLDLQKITEGKSDPSHKYYKLKDRMKYHQIKYDPNEKLITS